MLAQDVGQFVVQEEVDAPWKQQIPQGVPAELETVFKGLDQALPFALVERGGLKEGLQLIKRLAEVGEALLPADVGRHGGGAMAAGSSSQHLAEGLDLGLVGRGHVTTVDLDFSEISY